MLHVNVVLSLLIDTKNKFSNFLCFCNFSFIILIALIIKLYVLFVLLCYLGRPFSDKFFLVLLLSSLALNIDIIQSVITSLLLNLYNLT